MFGFGSLILGIGCVALVASGIHISGSNSADLANSTVTGRVDDDYDD